MRINQESWGKRKRGMKVTLGLDSSTCWGTSLSKISFKSWIAWKLIKETTLLDFSFDNQIEESSIRVKWLKGLSNNEFKSFKASLNWALKRVKDEHIDFKAGKYFSKARRLLVKACWEK